MSPGQKTRIKNKNTANIIYILMFEIAFSDAENTKQ